jgi:hypothetical protein
MHFFISCLAFSLESKSGTWSNDLESRNLVIKNWKCIVVGKLSCFYVQFEESQQDHLPVIKWRHSFLEWKSSIFSDARMLIGKPRLTTRVVGDSVEIPPQGFQELRFKSLQRLIKTKMINDCEQNPDSRFAWRFESSKYESCTALATTPDSCPREQFWQPSLTLIQVLDPDQSQHHFGSLHSQLTVHTFRHRQLSNHARSALKIDDQAYNWMIRGAQQSHVSPTSSVTRRCLRGLLSASHVLYQPVSVLGSATIECRMNRPAMNRIRTDLKSRLCKCRDEKALILLANLPHSAFTVAMDVVFGEFRHGSSERQLWSWLFVSVMFRGWLKGDKESLILVCQYDALVICWLNILSSQSRLCQRPIAKFDRFNFQIENDQIPAHKCDVNMKFSDESNGRQLTNDCISLSLNWEWDLWRGIELHSIEWNGIELNSSNIWSVDQFGRNRC